MLSRFSSLSFVLVAFAVAMASLSASAQSPNLHLGDVDDDGVITVRDIALVVEHVKEVAPLDEHHAVLADVTKDGAVNQADVDELIKEVLETRTPENLPLSSVRFTSPAAGEGDVSVNRETIVHFTVPLAINATLDTTKFYAEFAGQQVLSRVEISSDRKKASLFYLEPLPANSRVKVTFDGSGLDDLLGRPFDGNGNGLEASALEQRSEEVYRMSFDTHSSSPIPATGITGRVLQAAPEASATVPAGYPAIGVPGVTITVDGQEQTMRTTTDAQGYFTLTPCPSGVFFVHIDGRTSPWSAWPGSQYFPTVGKQWEAVPGKADNLAAGTGLVYLPCVCAGTLQPTSQTQATTVAFPQQVLTLNPALAGTTIDIPANSVFSDDGTRGGKIGIAPVPADRLPSPLPPGLNLPLVITVQSDGATNLDRPAPVCFPNLPDPVTGIKPGPGEKSALWSFNHDTGQWEVVGPMTVTADGNFVKSDAGVGIRQPGWHGSQPGCQGKMGPIEEPNDEPDPPPPPPCDPIVYTAPNMQGKNGEPIMIHPDAKPMFDALNALAGENNLRLDVRQSFREDGVTVDGAIVDPAKSSNHLVGHAVDVNILYGPGFQLRCNSSCMGSRASRPAVVSRFIDAAKDQGLRWGGDFNKRDPVHFDDGFNVSDPSGYKDEYKCYQRTVSHGSSSSNNLIQAKTASFGFTANAVPALTTQSVSANGALITHATSGPLVLAIQSLEDTLNVLRIRTTSTALKGTAFTLAPVTWYKVMVYNPFSNRVGWRSIETGEDGTINDIPTCLLLKSQQPDSDGDGIPDDAEFIIGTDPNNPDTDNDGVTDGAELKNGTDPLSGIAAATGIVGKGETGGDCRDVAAVNDVLAAACGAEGLQLLGVRQGLSPTKLAKVATPSPATVVAMTGSLVAVGMGSGGTLIVDASTPDTPQVLRTIKLGSSVRSLAAVENTVYIGFDDGRLTGVDMLTGRLLANVNLGSAVQDIAIGNGVVYAAVVNALKTVPVTSTGSFGTVTSLSMSASLGAGGQRLRLFRGTDRLYAVHTEGFNVFNIATAATPVFIRNNTDGAYGWRHIVGNGSGLALAATGPNSTDDGPHNVALYNLGADNAQANFLTTFTLPGSAYASVFYNGLGYVADGTAGVQVVNIRPFDTLKVAPTITLTVTNTAGAVTEGGFVPVSALVTDDVQVRNVEFYVDGVKAETDGNFPFETRVLAPRIAPGKTTGTFKAKATDTGGNFAWSSDITLNLNTETIPPTVLSMTPPNGQFMAQCSGFTLKFSEPVKTSTLTASTVRFYAAGTDGLIGTDDDTAVTATLLPASEGSGTYRDTASWQTTAPLAPGTYRVLATLGIQDTAGNALAAPFSGVFIVSGGSDADGDGLADSVEIALGYDPNNQDSNGNGKADGDEDFDGDGLTNDWELRYGLQPNNTDSNANGLSDALEDPDKDELTNVQENFANSNPTKADTDGDGWPDQVEVQFASNAADAKSKPLSLFVGAPAVTTAIIGAGNYVAPPVNTAIIGTQAPTQVTIRIGSPPP